MNRDKARMDARLYADDTDAADLDHRIVNELEHFWHTNDDLIKRKITGAV